MKYQTKVQRTSGSLRTTIPKFIRDLIDLKQGEILEWVVDTKTEEITVKKLKE